MRSILALDQGTTSSRAILFDHDGVIVASAQKEFPQGFPRAGWVEHDPDEIWTSQLSVIRDLLEHGGVQGRDIAAVGIANQRETTVIWDRETGEAIYNAIVWQDRRTASWCDELRAKGHEPMIQSHTGLPIDPYFSAGKIAWILDQVPGARERAEHGLLAFGTIDSWLVWKLTSGRSHVRSHVTDVSNASRTMLFNIHTGAWDQDILKVLRIPASLLPEVRSSSGIIAEIKTLAELEGVPIGALIGDQQAALFGQLCVTPGMMKTTYGTGCFLLQNTGEKAVVSRNRLLTTVAWKIGDRLTYANEGSIFVGGAVVQWLRDGLGLSPSAAGVEALAASVPDNGGIYLVPAFVGLGAPHWDPYARGAILGLTRGTTAAHIARAALESIAYQVADLVDALAADTGIRPDELRVDGGASTNTMLMQFQADLLDMPVLCPRVTETTALGAAYLAGLAVGFWPTPQALPSQERMSRRLDPRMPRGQADGLRKRWKAALERAKNWENLPAT
jgi:glycerol kinase